MSEEDKKLIEDLLNINPRNMSYKQLVSMQNGWWETLNLLSEQNKENKQLKDQLQQKENIIKEVREYIEEKIELYTVDLTEKNKNKLSYTAPIRAVYKELLEILDKEKNNE